MKQDKTRCSGFFRSKKNTSGIGAFRCKTCSTAATRVCVVCVLKAGRQVGRKEGREIGYVTIVTPRGNPAEAECLYVS